MTQSLSDIILGNNPEIRQMFWKTTNIFIFECFISRLKNEAETSEIQSKNITQSTTTFCTSNAIENICTEYGINASY